MEGDGNPIGGRTAFVAGGFETDVGVAVLSDVEGVGFTTLTGGNGYIVLIPLEGGVVGGVVDSLEVGGLAGLDMPVALDMNLGFAVDGEAEAADGVAVLTDGTFGEADGVDGGRGVGGAVGSPSEAFALGNGGVVIVFVVDHNDEVSDGVVAGVGAFVGTSTSQDGVDGLVKVHEVAFVVVEGEGEFVTYCGVDDKTTGSFFNLNDVEDKGLVGKTFGVTVPVHEGIAVGGRGIGAVGGEFGHLVFVASVGFESGIALGVGTAAFIVGDDGHVIDAIECNDVDTHDAVATVNGMDVSIVGIANGGVTIGLAAPDDVAATNGVDKGGVGDTVGDDDVDGVIDMAGGGDGLENVGGIGGDGVVAMDVTVASHDGGVGIEVAGEDDVDGDDAIATFDSSEGTGVETGLGDDFIVPEVGASGVDGAAGGVGVGDGKVDIDFYDGVTAAGDMEGVEVGTVGDVAFVVPVGEAVASELMSNGGIVGGTSCGEVKHVGGGRVGYDDGSVSGVGDVVDVPGERATYGSVGDDQITSLGLAESSRHAGDGQKQTQKYFFHHVSLYFYLLLFYN